MFVAKRNFLKFQVKPPNWEVKINYSIGMNATKKFYFSLWVFGWGSIQILSFD